MDEFSDEKLTWGLEVNSEKLFGKLFEMKREKSIIHLHNFLSNKIYTLYFPHKQL